MERAERGWGRWCREVGAVLRETLAVLRGRSGWFLILAAAAFLVRLPYLKWLVPSGGPDGWVYAKVLVVSHAQMFLNYALALVCWNLGASSLRGEPAAGARALLSRVWRSLPWVLALYAVEIGSSLLGLGFFKAGEFLCGSLAVKEPFWMLSGALLCGGAALASDPGPVRPVPDRGRRGRTDHPCHVHGHDARARRAPLADPGSLVRFPPSAAPVACGAAHAGTCLPGSIPGSIGGYSRMLSSRFSFFRSPQPLGTSGCASAAKRGGPPEPEPNPFRCKAETSACTPFAAPAVCGTPMTRRG